MEERELEGLDWVDDEPDPALERWRSRPRPCPFCDKKRSGPRCYSAMARARNLTRVGIRQYHRCTNCDQPGHNSRTCAA